MIHGGKIFSPYAVKKIVVEGGEARGVQLDDGPYLEAKMGVISTLDISQTFLNLVGEDKLDGDFVDSVKQGQYHPLQMGYMRPHEQYSTHRSPVKNLFMGGRSTYPGGTVLLGSGYLAADAVVEDCGIKKWWQEPEMVKKARERGLL